MTSSKTKTKKSFWRIADSFEGDKVVWIIVLMLFLFSLVCMFSSTSKLLKGEMTRIDLLRTQLYVVLGGLVVIIICYNIKNIDFFRKLSVIGFPLSFLLLLLLDIRINTSMVKAIEINGAYRILSINGVQFHIFEVVKVAMVMYFAWALDAYKKGKLRWPEKDIWKKVLYIYAPFLITFVMIIPGSNSSALIIGFLMAVVILIGGGSKKDMGLLALAGISAIMISVAIYYVSDGKAMKRIGTAISRIFDDEDNEKKFLEARKGSLEWQEALDAMRQPVSAKIAVHEGGIFGKGPGQSTQRYVVPDISEDYMYSFIIEEYGLFGGILVIILYVSLLARGSLIVRNCGDNIFAKAAVAGLCLLITGQAFLHMFVNADIGPMTGQTLPLISHGNSAFLCFSVAFGIILSFSRIAARRIEIETLKADPLMETHENLKGSLDELDAFDSGKQFDEDGI